MPSRGERRFDQALSGITIGVVNDMEDRRRMEELDGLNEIDEQVQLEFAGQAEEFASWTEVDVEFANHFVDATGQRDSSFDRPHFTYGADQETPTPVGVLATVMRWLVNERNETVGARIAIGILATDRSAKVRGRVHLTFQGYGYAPPVVPEDLGE